MPGQEHPKNWQILLLVAGPVTAAAVFFLIPDAFATRSGEVQDVGLAPRVTLAVASWMAVWWITEVVPMALTALLPLLLFSVLQVQPVTALLASHTHPLIFLFFGGFVISIALQTWSLDKRFALLVLSAFGRRRAGLIAGFMLATAFLSMWISNTATSIMMLPIALSVIAVHADSPNFARCLMLSIAYSASIGGMATIIGTPPNTFVASYLRDNLDLDVSFLQWMIVGLPCAGVFLVACWFYLVFVRFRMQTTDVTTGKTPSIEVRAFGFAQWATLIVFASVAGAWIGRPWLSRWHIFDATPLDWLSDAKIAVLGALALLIIPAGTQRKRRLVTIGELKSVPWGTLVLFGGGLALANTISATGADLLIGAGLSGLPTLPTGAILLVIVCLVVFMTELTSNIATTATLVPVLAASANVFGIDATTVIVATAFSASCAFMLPVATPPNAIIYGSGKITVRDMATAGFALNLLGIMIVTYVMHYWFKGFA